MDRQEGAASAAELAEAPEGWLACVAMVCQDEPELGGLEILVDVPFERLQRSRSPPGARVLPRIRWIGLPEVVERAVALNLM